MSVSVSVCVYVAVSVSVLVISLYGGVLIHSLPDVHALPLQVASTFVAASAFLVICQDRGANVSLTSHCSHLVF